MHTHPSHFPLHNHSHPGHFLLCKRKRPMPLSMEEEKSMEISISSSGGTPSTSRWNPTKEQISLLEGLYNQGIRTPSAEQIQQITSRLRAYGHIEGKNVFYWFQNHKARQRQKQKQESMMIVNSILHKASPILAPHPCTNVFYGSYCIPQPPMTFYPQCPKVLPPGGMRRPRGEKPQEKKSETHVEEHEFPHSNPDIMALDDSLSPETLQLFPLHPTGILETRSGNASASPSTQTSNIEEINGEQTLFNFWSSDNGSCRSR